MRNRFLLTSTKNYGRTTPRRPRPWGMQPIMYLN
jgi:hypothetical protein